MNSQLIVFHPYRSLSELQVVLALTADEVALAWSVINDHYLTDLPLLHPPHVIAVMAILVAVIFKPNHHPVMVPAGNPSATGALRDGSINIMSAMNDRGGIGMPARVQKVVDWLAHSEVDIEAVIESTQEIISLYEVWEQYSDKICKEQIGRFVKSRGLDK